MQIKSGSVVNYWGRLEYLTDEGAGLEYELTGTALMCYELLVLYVIIYSY